MTRPDHPDPIEGIHHVTVMSGDPDGNVRFFRNVLGLRLVKRTVNFDDVTTYHLYYGDEVGTPGTVYTAFPFGGGRRGRNGTGEASATAFAVPEGSLDYWRDRLESRGVEVREPEERFGARVLPFTDPDGQELELVEREARSASDGSGRSPQEPFGGVEPWADSPVPEERRIRGFHGVTLRLAEIDATADLLEFMGYEEEAAAADRTRFRGAGDRAAVVDLVERPDAAPAGGGIGSVHHVAFRVPDDEAQVAWQSALRERGQHATPVKDRRYFRSIYFREPGGVLFEFATDGPGFDLDEPVEALGGELKLPDWLEDDRERVESALPPLSAAAEPAVRDADGTTDGTVGDAEAGVATRD
ncbi:ring-cleaving dioxygenase [Halorarum salinum]|uniref:Ring-cleaving dioxygenase n=1 Tax=Halorarum salinum TaxID=2743089 RepID=A0A7D5QFL0_9EURY|nr:ring-cleaving dioxygenase [Halobaculum salinum]QLG61523.1 ring-cleaving dioxygenase [Halobaculum salinum]